MSHPLFNANARIALLCLLACSAYAQEAALKDSEEASGAAPAAQPLPSALDNYNIKKETLLAADSKDNKDNNQVGTSDAAKAAAKAMGADKGKNELPIEVELKPVEVRAKRFYEVGPLPGLGLTKEEIPGNVQSISAEEIKQSHSLSLTDLMNKKLQSVNVNDYQGNPFQMDVTYRGFTAGPQIGTPQGLSVFFDGIRVNEPFGDVVNWDMIPMNAIAGVDVFPGSNPIFGLNTLGGAFTLKTKDGFNFTGADAEVLAGSYGRKQLQVSGGWNNGTVALFGAGNFFLEDGWRQNSPSKVNQVFGKGSYRSEKLDLSLSTLLVQTDLVGNGLVPSEMYAQDPTSVYSSQDTTKNTLGQFQLAGSYFVDESFSITGQVYRRNSKRKQKSGDVFTGYDEALLARRKPTIDPATGQLEQYTCLFTSTNSYGIPDYYVVPVVADPVNGADFAALSATPFFNELFNTGTIDNSTGTYNALKNQALDSTYASAYKQTFDYYKNIYESSVYNRDNPTPVTDGPQTTYSFGTDKAYSAGLSWFGGAYLGTSGGTSVLGSLDDFYYTTDPNTGVVTKNYIITIAPTNAAACDAAHATQAAGGPNNGGNAYTYTDPKTGLPTTVDGAGTGQSGVVEGTPTGIVTDNQIDQVVDGASLQFNWNIEHHKFMVGASVDKASADYSNTQQLGFLTANREVYLDPSQANPQFAGAFEPISNNNFAGTSVTQSLYFSETWTPIETLHLNTSARYNQTSIKNTIAARYGIGAYQIGDLVAIPDEYNICPNGDCTNVTTNYRNPNIFSALNKSETEKFSYESLNPSLGASWQVKENLNAFANIAKGSRTPSVIELGCALDKTPTADTGGNIVWKSIAENRFCSLPTTLSGDPFLKQIKSTSYDIGLRGTIGDNTQWNIGAYQTDLKNDIYFVAVGSPGQGFFDNVGNTRRRGLEAGISGKQNRIRYSLNYGLTEATFQDTFYMMSEDNSSAVTLDGYGNGIIQVKPGNRMPGVPLHNLNANLSYDLTDKWSVSLNGVLHSESFLRGNENNEHQQGAITSRTIISPTLGTIIVDSVSTNPGKVAGYATFNFQTSYKINKEWTATVLVNNLLDKEYFSAGRLGRNPFSPSIYGAIGPDGYNHNSSDWQSTNFIAPAAPRGIWFSLNWQFDASK